MLTINGFAFDNVVAFNNADNAFAFDNALYSIRPMMHSHLIMYSQGNVFAFDNALAFGIDQAFMCHFDYALRGCPCI